MAHMPRKFELKDLDGFSEDQISQHRDILYTGYVNKLNEIEDRLKNGLDRNKSNQVFSEYRSLKADETFALNGVVLHELYFENLGGNGLKPANCLLQPIARDFGSFEIWQEDFRACGMAARGWGVLGYSFYDEKLHNYCLDSHNFNVPACVIPILVMDVYEHAYTIDFGVKRTPYIEAFMKNIDWKVCTMRFQRIEGGKNIMLTAAC